MNWKRNLFTMFRKIRALFRKEFLVYADQRAFVFLGLVFQAAFFLAIFGLFFLFKNELKTGVLNFSLSYGQYSYLVLLLILLFSSISGFLPNRILEELEEGTLTAVLLTPSSFGLWVLASGLFGLLTNFFYLLFLLVIGVWFFQLNLAGGFLLIWALLLAFGVIFGLALNYAGLILIFKRAFLIYGLIETGLIVLIAFLAPANNFHFLGGNILKITPYYLVFKTFQAGLEGHFFNFLRYQFFLAIEIAGFWILGVFILQKGFDRARKNGVFR